MGQGASYSCFKCGYAYSYNNGVGFMFPTVYRETVEKAKKGKLGKVLKKFFEEHPDGAINAEYVTLCCEDCGELKNGMDLGMYVPEKEIPARRNVRWCVAAPQEDISYVTTSDLKELYKKYADYPHKCRKCKGRMRVLAEDETLICPKCKKPMELIDSIMWD